MTDCFFAFFPRNKFLSGNFSYRLDRITTPASILLIKSRVAHLRTRGRKWSYRERTCPILEIARAVRIRVVAQKKCCYSVQIKATTVVPIPVSFRARFLFTPSSRIERFSTSREVRFRGELSLGIIINLGGNRGNSSIPRTRSPRQICLRRGFRLDRSVTGRCLGCGYLGSEAKGWRR